MCNIVRRTARAIILNSKNEVLLLRIKGKPLKIITETNHFWVTVGGEIEEGESYESALKRELREEVGISEPKDEELFAFGEHILSWKGTPTRFIEKFYLIRADEINYHNRHLTAEELLVIEDYRWWSIDDLTTTDEVIFP